MADRIDGAVRRLLKNEKRFEKLVQRVRGIREPEMPQRVGDEQMPELIVDIGCGNRMMRKQSEAKADGQE